MENYVKMLRAPGADWIQEAWVPKVGHRTDRGFIIGIHIPGSTCLIRDESEWVNLYSIKSVLWLPSIEDLLGMVDWDNEERYATLFRLDGKFAINLGRSRVFYGLSWAECWLQVVQHIVKSLSWDGEDAKWN